MQQLTKQNTARWREYTRVFLLCLLVSAALFLPHCIIDGLQGDFFHYAGDFNDQQIPFYSYANAFVKQGGTFSWATDLGSGFVNSYSFYLVGSPFFWLTLLLPSDWTPWIMVPMLCLKFALAGGGAYLWARRWLRDSRYAMLAGCLYAFSGFTVYNVFFNHFLDVVALFPYLLASLDDAVFDDRKGPLAFWLAVNLLNNYFFFVGQAVFLVIYFVCLWVGRAYKVTPRLFGRLAAETVLGCLMGCALLLPAGLSLLQNPRTIDPFDGYGYLVYGKAQQYLAILYSAFLVPEAPYLTDLFNEGILKWTSLTAYLPVVGVAGGLAFCRARRDHPFSRILKVCVVCAFVPVLNSMFYAFNSSFYARWYYMPVLVLCAATGRALEDTQIRRAELPRAVKTMALVVLSTVAFALVPHTVDGKNTFGVVEEPARYWAIFAVTMLGVGLFVLVLRRTRERPHRLPAFMMAAVLGFSFVYGSLHLSFAKYGQWYNDANYVQQTAKEAEILNEALPDDAFYRIDAFECYNNMGLWLDRSCIQFFNSTVAPHILEFYPTVGVTRDVNSKPGFDLYALRGLLGVRYTLVPLDKETEWQELELQGWVRGDEAGSYVLYENENWVPLGTAYEYAMSEADFEKVPEKQRGNVLMKTLVLDEEQTEACKDLLTPIPEGEGKDRSYETYVKDCNDRRADGVQTFTATDTGFTATCAYDRERIVLFAVPYDDGFAAAVNGEPVDILKADHGLMAVHVPAGESEVVFTYRTPGMNISLPVSVAAWVVFAVWMLVKKRKQRIR